ncbi:unnamed protein product [Nezara viridula]|uniref:Tubulin/FtsZ GTPase domain-containing protein n=1 Tax=Nezara viridula TaxID=85310 RepID=A0A9P0H9M6_NEZVI|nr:unnamed protein product [Nezara viridula]
MSEFIVIQVGQCGNQIGNAFWPLVLYEHGICVDKLVKPSLKAVQDEAFHSFFDSPSYKKCHNIEDLKRCKVKARAILIDMETSVVERFHNCRLRDLFDRTYSITDSPGSGNNWAFGHYEAGNLHKNKIREMIRSAAECCSSLNGFLLFFSLAGGTGSGLGTAVLQYLQDDFPNIDRIVACVHPGEHRDVVTSPYNIAFSLSKLALGATCVFPVDNKSLSKICGKTKVTKDPLTSDLYQKVNAVIVRMLLNLTSGARFPGSLNFDLGDLPTNMVPYKGMHFLASSICPLVSGSEIGINILKRKKELLHSVCNEDHHLIQLNALSGKVHTAALIARGDIPFSTAVDFQERLIAKIKRKPMGITLGLSSVPPHDSPVSLLLLTNSSSMSTFFSQAVNDFNSLYFRKAYTHHYLKVDDFEFEEFSGAREVLLSQVDAYTKTYEDIHIPRINVEI